MTVAQVKQVEQIANAMIDRDANFSLNVVYKNIYLRVQYEDVLIAIVKNLVRKVCYPLFLFMEDKTRTFI